MYLKWALKSNSTIKLKTGQRKRRVHNYWPQSTLPSPHPPRFSNPRESCFCFLPVLASVFSIMRENSPIYQKIIE